MWPSAEPTAPALRDTQSRILIVDDEALNLKLLKATLGQNYEVKEATSGPEALKILQAAFIPDLILLDIMMPEMDGYEVCRQLKSSAHTRHIPVIFITAQDREEDELQGFEVGAVDFITKPFKSVILQQRISTQLDLKRHRNHLEELVRQRTHALDIRNTQLKQEVARRQQAQRQLIEVNQRLEHRVSERTAELENSHQHLKNLLAKQEVNIDLAKSILRLVNGPITRYTPIDSRLTLFAEALSIPCYAEGGDHFFVRQTESEDCHKTIISLKDQSGHEVNCVLRSIITDLIHNAIISQDSTLPLQKVLSRLNNEICQAGVFADGDYFTAMTVEIDHATLRLRYVSNGHPPIILIRESDIHILPKLGEKRQQPAGSAASKAVLRCCRVSAKTWRPADSFYRWPDRNAARARGQIDAYRCSEGSCTSAY